MAPLHWKEDSQSEEEINLHTGHGNLEFYERLRTLADGVPRHCNGKLKRELVNKLTELVAL